MKELLKDEFESNKVDKEIVASIEKKKEHQLIARHRIVKGHILWKFNDETKDLSDDIKYKKTDYVLGESDKSLRMSVEVERGYIYFQALNRKNAIKKLKKSGFKI